MTSRNTFESTFHQRLLDLLYSQWNALGASFVNRHSFSRNEIIDLEALLWCSLEFLPTQPRLQEAVIEWIERNNVYLIRQRIYKLANKEDPRAMIWRSLDRRASKENKPATPSEPCYGLDDPADVFEFVRTIEKHKSGRSFYSSRLSRKVVQPAALLLKARDLFGHDIRHFLLVYLLANPQGGKLRDAQAWSGHSYRSFFDAADRWEATSVVTLESGHCRLTAPDLFRALLSISSEQIVLVSWRAIFDASVRLLRDLARARRKGFGDDSPLIASLHREFLEKLQHPRLYSLKTSDASVDYLLADLQAAPSLS